MVVLEVGESQIGSSFQVACLASAWKLLVDRGGTLALCGLSKSAHSSLQGVVETSLFNIFDTVDAAIDWLGSGFAADMEKNFPRAVKCGECGSQGEVAHRGDHVCTGCGMTYLVTERGELLF